MQQLAHRHSQRIIDENQNLRSELESKISELNERSKQLDDLSEKSGYDRRNLDQEKQKVRDFMVSCTSSSLLPRTIVRELLYWLSFSLCLF
jgi:uncharacterized membrane-anchored protein YhcB (DUF1043 family)